MSLGFFRPDPVAEHVSLVLGLLADGNAPEGIERAQVDVKEEPGRREQNGQVCPGRAENDEAAKYLAGEMACLANTRGGGAIILGVGNKGERIGTALDMEWMRHRIFELTNRQLTITVREATLDGTRLLVLTAPEAIEPIRYKGRIHWRVSDHCVEIDAASWHAETRRRVGADWSAEPSGHPLEAANPVALEFARRYLRAAGDTGALELANATAPDLLRRLNVVTGDDVLTKAGALLFVGTPHDGIDYRHREVTGGDSTARVRGTGPLLEQVAMVEAATEAKNRLVHVTQGFAHGQLHELPPLALREAIVNGAIHRDWLSTQATIVEHIGTNVTVTSPGGFLGGVRPSNIITHPSAPRYRSLAEAVATLRLAEREGVGVDRIVREMLALGHHPPEISEIDGPYVRVSLIGGPPKPHVLGLLASLDPAIAARDVDVLLLLHHLMQHGWVDIERAAPVLQRPTSETQAAITRLLNTTSAGAPVIVAVQGVRPEGPSAYRFSDYVRKRLADNGSGREDAAARSAMLLAWARARRRISSTEVADLTGVSKTYAGTLLLNMETNGTIKRGRENRMGRGFFYVPVSDDETTNTTSPSS